MAKNIDPVEAAQKVERIARIMRHYLKEIPFCDPDINDLEQAAATLRAPREAAPTGGDGKLNDEARLALWCALHPDDAAAEIERLRAVLSPDTTRSAVVEECATYIDDVATFYPPDGGSKSLLDTMAKEIRTLASNPYVTRVKQQT